MFKNGTALLGDELEKYLSFCEKMASTQTISFVSLKIMLRMKYIFLVPILAMLVVFLQSCKKDQANAIPIPLNQHFLD